VFAAFPPGPVSAPVTWKELPDVEINDFTIATMPARFAALGDVHQGIHNAAWDIEPPLEWADRDERDGGIRRTRRTTKQEGEPPRVQPSRMNRANWVDKEHRPAPRSLRILAEPQSRLFERR
jgi:hypothetical protein